MRKFCKEIADLILADIAEGIPYKIAAESNGITERLLYMWLEQGLKDATEDKDTEHRNLLQSLRAIEGKRIKRNLAKIREKAKGHRGCEWELERSFWKYFSDHAQNIELAERLEKLEQGNLNEEKSEG